MTSAQQGLEPIPETLPKAGSTRFEPWSAEREPSASPAAPSDARLQSFEARVRRALRDRREDRLRVIGYGEVTSVLAVDDGWVCKRIPAFPSAAAAQRCAAVIRRYVDALRAAGLDVWDTDVRVVASVDDERGGARRDAAPGATWSVYCLQRRLDPGTLAPEVLRRVSREEALAYYDRILRAIACAVSPRLAPDGQLSNWAFVGDRLVYLDVSSPFLRDPAGNDVLDWTHYLRSLPAPLRPVVRRWALPRLLDKYFTLRGQIVDLLGNLKKERLAHLTEPFRLYANELVEPLPRVGPDEIDRYYTADARTYAVLQAARRLDRWAHRVIGRPYPYVLPPRIERNARLRVR